MTAKTEKKSVQKSEKKSGKKSPTIQVTLMRGYMCTPPAQRAVLKGLGLKNRHQVKELQNIPSVRGMIKKVLHLVQVVE